MKKMLFAVSSVLFFVFSAITVISCGAEANFVISSVSRYDIDITAQGGRNSGTYTVKSNQKIFLKLDEHAVITTDSTLVYIKSGVNTAQIVDISNRTASIVNLTGDAITVSEAYNKMPPVTVTLANEDLNNAATAVLTTEYPEFILTPAANSLGKPYIFTYTDDLMDEVIYLKIDTAD